MCFIRGLFRSTLLKAIHFSSFVFVEFKSGSVLGRIAEGISSLPICLNTFDQRNPHIFFKCFTPISPLSHVVGTGVLLLGLLERSESSRSKFPLLKLANYLWSLLTSTGPTLYGVFSFLLSENNSILWRKCSSFSSIFTLM